MNENFTNRKLAVVYSPNFMIQAAHDAAIANGNLTARHPQTTPAFHNNVAFREEIRSCDAAFVIKEELTGKIARFTLGFLGTAKQAAGWHAYLLGTAAAPTGTPAHETQTLALGGATGGDASLGFSFEGLAGVTSLIPTTAATTAAQVQAALEALRPIKAGGVAVTGSAGGPFTISFAGGNLKNANLPLITVEDDNSTGGSGVTIAPATNGENKTHLITRQTSDVPDEFSLIEGFEGETGGTKKYKNLVMADYTATINRRGKAALTIVAYGDPTAEVLSGFSIPACETVEPIAAKDTRLLIGTEYITSDLRELTYTESNNIDVSEDALRFDDPTPDQLKRGDPTASLNALFLGSPTSAMYEFAEDENNAFDNFALSLGRPGERYTIISPNAQFRLDDNLIEFVGTRNVSAFRVLGRPVPDAGVFTRGEFHGAFTGQFLLNA
jgi:hypothetical protein